MKWNWREMQHLLVQWKRTRELAQEAVPVVQCWIEVQLTRYGKDLDREDAIQELWLFVMERVIPRLNTKLGNWHHYILLCIRQEIAKIRRRKLRQERTVPLQGVDTWPSLGLPARRQLRRNPKRLST